MRQNHVLYGLWAILAAMVRAEEDVLASSSDVVELTKANFTEFVSSNDLVLTEFYAPWCQYCKALAPDYEEAAASLKRKGIDVRLAKVDCIEEKELCAEFGVGGYPDLKVVRGPGQENVAPYTGPRNVDGIVSFMTRQSLPLVSSLTEDDIARFKSADNYVLIAHVPAGGDATSREAFEKAAEDLRRRFLCGVVERNDIDTAKIVLYKNTDGAEEEAGEEQEATFSSPFDSEAIKTFAVRAIIPAIGEVNSDTLSLYRESNLPVGWIFTSTASDRSRLVELLSPVARTHRNEIHLGTIDATEYAGTAADLNLEPDLGYPAFAILDFATLKKYPFPQTREITREAIAGFVADFLGGTLKASITSQPVPEKQDGPVAVVVGRSFQEVVVDNDKDVLVQIYAPWCGHSKRLAPKYEILGSEYAASNFTDKVTLAKIDGTVNDVPDGIPKGYPMLMLYPAGAKDAPVMYDGDRSLEDLVKFISEKGKYGASISISEKAAEAVVAAAAAEESPAARDDESESSKHDEL